MYLKKGLCYIAEEAAAQTCLSCTCNRDNIVKVRRVKVPLLCLRFSVNKQREENNASSTGQITWSSST